jgi:sec-independent protein translocase protein TatB
MFEVGWTEMLVIAVVMIVVVGPKDLPRMLRTIGKMTAKVRGMAGDFQRQFNEALKEAELDEVKKSVDSLRSMNPVSDIKKQLNPFEQAAADVRAGLQSALGSKPAASGEPASTQVHEAEPLKNGATAMPDIAGPTAMPPPPAGLSTPPAEPAQAAAAASAASVAVPATANGAGKPASSAKAASKASAKRARAATASPSPKSASANQAPAAQVTETKAATKPQTAPAKASAKAAAPARTSAPAKKPARNPN